MKLIRNGEAPQAPQGEFEKADMDPRAAMPVTPSENGGGVASELAYRLRQQELAAEFGLFALKTHDLTTLLQEATRVCAQGLQSGLCKALEYLPDEHQFTVRAGVGWRPGVVGHARVGADDESPTGYALRTGKPVISNHLSGERRFRTPKLLLEHGVKRAINVVIQAEGRPYGILEVDSPTEGRFTDIDVAFLQAFANLLGVAIERQKAEEAMRQNGALLQQAAAHQALLTREISHRVKNGLSLVGSLLSMQSRMSSDPDLRRALADAQMRVEMVAQLHDRLWREDEVHAINLAEFMGELCNRLRWSGPNHALTCDVAPVTVTTDQAMPLGLLANELVTNAFKYAYPGGSGEVRLSVGPTDRGHLRLQVCDRGMGLPPASDPATSGSFGMKLIANLGRQLGGRIEWQDAQPGTRFVLDFFPREAVSRKP